MVVVNSLLPLVILAAAASEPVPRAEESPQSYPATVAAVVEGDVLKVAWDDTTQEVRLFGVDCPEAGQPFADKAKAFVTKAVLKKEIQVQQLTTDNLGKGVVVVLLPDKANLGHALVEAGLAWWDLQNAPKDRTLKALNAKALVEQKGLWTDPAPLSPWDYRRSHGIQDFTYSIVPVPPKPRSSEAEEEGPKVLSAKGDELYTGGAYVLRGESDTNADKSRALPARAQGRPAFNGQVVDAGAIDFSTSRNLDVGQLVLQHQPRIVNGPTGAPLGITASDIGRAPFARQLGFQDGDIITGVNGVQITGLAQIMELAPKFENVKKLNVNVLRNGEQIGWTITVP